MKQRHIPPNPRRLEMRLIARLGKPVHVIYTQNRVRMISVKERYGILQVRVHEAFAEAPKEVLEELSEWLSSPHRKPSEIIRSFIESIQVEASPSLMTLQPQDSTTEELPLFAAAPPDPALKALPPPPRGLKTKGSVYDLQELYDQVNRKWFNGEIRSHITWGRDNSHKTVRSRRLGSYRHDQKLITIHPVLDDTRVPRKVVAFTVFHEMLHSLQPPGHRRPHDAAFRKAERAHPDYTWVQRWRKENLEVLIGGAWPLATRKNKARE